MNFKNYGEWEIDHIIPVSSFDFSIKQNIFECFNFRNLQPLWRIEQNIIREIIRILNNLGELVR